MILPLFAGGILLMLAVCLAAMGIERFYKQPVSWRRTALITGLSSAGLLFFIFAYDSSAMRVLVYSTAQSLPLALTLKLLLSHHDGRVSPGARLAGGIACLIIALYAVRAFGNLIGFDFSFTRSSLVQGALTLALIFLSMSLNFGFLLMAIDRLRNEVAELALIDDLTGVGNRRQLMQRLSRECARSERGGEPFVLLVIDIDGVKQINDTSGRAAGDACLQHFTLMAQTRLRPGDLLARTGGDEFCIVLPSSTLREGTMIARRVLDVCRQDAEGCAGNDVPVAVSIGAAQWSREVGTFPDRLIVAADHALYAARKGGKNRYAAYDAAPPLAPEPEALAP
jgi:diguanylate cyclase (GGDEF)-like protein